MTELNLIQPIVSRLETQVQDYIEVRNPTTRARLIQVISKFKASNNRRYQSRNRGPSENFIRWDPRHGGRLNSLRVRVDQDDPSQNVRNPPIRLSASICMSPVELPYVPILLNETFTKALWDTLAEKSFISRRMFIKTIQDSQIEDTAVDEGNQEIDLSKTKLNVVADVSSGNQVESIVDENVLRVQ
ncbi:hypothetical protein TNCV_2135811 [Trichonephila clavipes]|nr:hypothetical protein TNCV_2135811 [Trichonephila clavipes]